MTVHLMNSVMCPQEGTYIVRKIRKKDFVDLLKSAYQQNKLKSYIGYPQNIELIKAWTGITVPLNRGQAILKDGDYILAMRLKYRPQNPASKGDQVDEKEFEFYFVQYTEV